MKHTAAAASEPARPLAPQQLSAGQSPLPSMIVVGKDVLELLSSAMYVDPLSIYREYIQNAADAIDEARTTGALGNDEPGRVDVTVDAAARRIVIKDNGAGITTLQAAQRLLAIGASAKRGIRARGFRGVGRLAGLAYGRALTFRTRAAGDDEVIELRWDCQRLRVALREVAQNDDIGTVIQRVVTIVKLEGSDWPRNFFEVELTDVIRTKRDILLNPLLVGEYLEQVAPVPFATHFGWGDQILKHLIDVRLGNLDIRIGNAPPLRRPFHDTLKVTDLVTDSFVDIELLTLTDLDGGLAGVGWVLHHGYRGSIMTRSRVSGIRCRVGNVQIGDESLLEEVFPETRFNGWTVGEVHVLDPRIVPNARRDHFEQNIHFSNLTAQLEPLARRIAKRARTASVERNNARRAELADQLPKVNPQLVVDAAPAVIERTVTSVSVKSSSVLGRHAADSTLTNSDGHLSALQQQVLSRLRAVIKDSGLSKEEVQNLLLQV